MFKGVLKIRFFHKLFPIFPRFSPNIFPISSIKILREGGSRTLRYAPGVYSFVVEFLLPHSVYIGSSSCVMRLLCVLYRHVYILEGWDLGEYLVQCIKWFETFFQRSDRERFYYYCCFSFIISRLTFTELLCHIRKPKFEYCKWSRLKIFWSGVESVSRIYLKGILAICFPLFPHFPHFQQYFSNFLHQGISSTLDTLPRPGFQ